MHACIAQTLRLVCITWPGTSLPLLDPFGRTVILGRLLISHTKYKILISFPNQYHELPSISSELGAKILLTGNTNIACYNIVH